MTSDNSSSGPNFERTYKNLKREGIWLENKHCFRKEKNLLLFHDVIENTLSSESLKSVKSHWRGGIYTNITHYVILFNTHATKHWLNQVINFLKKIKSLKFLAFKCWITSGTRNESTMLSLGWNTEFQKKRTEHGHFAKLFR